MKHTQFIPAFYCLATIVACASPSQAQGVADTNTLLSGADINNDGIVTRDEFLAARAGIFNNVDANASGSLDQTEFTTALDERAKRFAKRAFAKVDTNGDGVVTQTEWDNAPTRAFDRLDSNNDNTLSTEERSKAQK